MIFGTWYNQADMVVLGYKNSIISLTFKYFSFEWWLANSENLYA